MKVIVFTKRCGEPAHLDLAHPRNLLLVLSFAAVLCAALIYGGYALAVQRVAVYDVAELTARWKEELHEQRRELDYTRHSADAHINALAMRLAQVQARAIRLDALGQRLTAMAKLDKDEFDFEQLPGQGGPEAATDMMGWEAPDIERVLDELARHLEDREHKLQALESMLLNRRLEQDAVLTGRPTTGGWLSSRFGTRSDPFTGRRVRHNGVDFAGRPGTDVVAVAAGVVTWSGRRGGYGNLVEISHGNGYVTRYAHNAKNLVNAGDVVKKGERIALLGSTGRSTGPHVHFEVLQDGKFVDPMKYIRAGK
jgi:murein DD-endopeptidase MepM/ murein hydrolase activator NlpD